MITLMYEVKTHTDVQYGHNVSMGKEEKFGNKIFFTDKVSGNALHF